MNGAEIKIRSVEPGDAVQSEVWQSGGLQNQAASGIKPAVDLSLRSFRNEAEVHAINCALQQTGGNRKQAAKLLGISYRSLLYKIREHNILPPVRHCGT